MRLKKKFEQFVQRNDNDLEESYKNITADFNAVNSRIDGWGKLHNTLQKVVTNMLDELANNGVIRDIRALQREFAEFREFKKHTVVLMQHHEEQLQDLHGNGVATAINKLQLEVFGKKKTGKSAFGSASFLRAFSGDDNIVPDEPTLNAKVDAILEFLKLDVTITPEEKIPSKAVAKKKPVTKKKGRR